MRSIESKTVSKAPERLCEDLLVTTQDFIAVIDGVTPKSDFCYKGKSTGRLAAECVAQAVKEAEKTDDCSCIIRRCNEKFRDFYRSVEFPYDKKEKKKLFLGQEYVPRKDTLPDYLSANEIRYGVNLYYNRCTNTPPLLTMANHRLRNNAETKETRKNGTRYS